MKVVVDSNRVLAAMIKDSTTRETLFDVAFLNSFIRPVLVNGGAGMRYRDVSRVWNKCNDYQTKTYDLKWEKKEGLV